MGAYGCTDYFLFYLFIIGLETGILLLYYGGNKHKINKVYKMANFSNL